MAACDNRSQQHVKQSKLSVGEGISGLVSISTMGPVYSCCCCSRAASNPTLARAAPTVPGMDIATGNVVDSP